MFFLAVNIIKKNCVIGKQGFSLFPFFVLGIVPIFANDNYTLTPDLPEVSAETAVSDPFIRRFLRSGSRIGRNDKNASMQ